MMVNSTPRKPGIYVHIPFCVRKCNYCAFLSMPADEDMRNQYVDALLEEISLQAKSNALDEVDTIYLGGGTPSILRADRIERILIELRSNFNISDNCEITIEVNPATLGSSEEEIIAKLTAYRSCGINRLSMGVQSMNDDRLRILGRIHDAEAVTRDVGLARIAGFDNINLDIIFSIPGTGTAEALADIEAIAALKPEHISYYSLQLEEGTDFFTKWENGEIEEVSDEVDRESYHRGCELLRQLGYEQYEISNFAREGRGSRHNSKYWDMTDYLGLGLGASSFLSGRRIVNLQNMKDYLDAIRNGLLPIDEEHVNTEHDNISEAIFTGLRRMRGIKYQEIKQGWSENDFRTYYTDVMPALEGYVSSGHLIMNAEGLILTDIGIDISNRIMAEFV